MPPVFLPGSVDAILCKAETMFPGPAKPIPCYGEEIPCFAAERNSQAVGYAVRARMIWLGCAVRILRMLRLCFLAVETMDRRRAKI
jgi:hypothetical protein